MNELFNVPDVATKEIAVKAAKARRVRKPAVICLIIFAVIVAGFVINKNTAGNKRAEWIDFRQAGMDETSSKRSSTDGLRRNNGIDCGDKKSSVVEDSFRVPR
jgi:hypothetical protein